MRNYIILNGQNSNSISGLLIQSLAPISKPLMRTEIEEIDGRDGDITTKLGYSAYDKEITIGLYGNYDINEVIAYFNSEGTVIFSNEPDKYYNYQIAAQIDFERLVRYKTATVTMHCQPFKYSATEGTGIFGASSNLVTIPNFSRTTNGITVSVANNIMTVSGKGSAATEFYVPIDTLSLAAGSYTMTAVGSGTAPEACSLRVIYDSPSSANSFGGGYVTLKNNTDVSLSATLTATKTYNYVYLYIAAGKNMNFTINLQIIDQAQATVSDEGTNLVLEGSAEAPFSQFDLKGNTSQQTYSGKNLINLTGVTSPSGVTGAITDGSTIKVTGTTGTNVNNNIVANLLSTIPAGTYTFTIDHAASHVINFTVNNSDGNVAFRLAPGETSVTKTLTSASTAGQVFWGLLANTTYNETFKLQLVAGSTPDYDYEPYVGGTASPNPDYPRAVQTVTGENVVKICGKNLLDVKNNLKASDGGLNFSYSNDKLVVSGTPTRSYANVTNEINTFLAAGQYTLSLTEAVSHRVYIWVRYTDGAAASLGIINAGGTSVATTFAKDVAQIRLDFSVITTGVALSESFSVQLEKGSSASSFEPYQEQLYPVSLGSIELCKIGDYQDYIYKDGSDWKIKKQVGKFVLDSAKVQSAYNKRYRYAKSDLNNAYLPANGTNYLCGYFTAVADDSYGVGSAYVGGTMVNFRYDENGDNIAGFKNFIDEVGLSLYCQLNSFPDITITNEALIAQLDDIYYHAHAYKERTHVSSTYATGNVPHIIAAAVTANMGDITVTNSGNFISKPTMTIFGSGNIGVYLNGIQLFQIALGDTEYITIDCAAMEAYKDTLETLQNRLVTGDYSNFVLNPGDNTISFSGSVTKFEISNYSRWL